MLWSQLFPEVARGAANAPSFMMERALRDAAIEFCTRTDVYKLEDEVLFAPEIDEYEVSPPSEYEVAHILDMTLVASNTKLTPASFEDMRDMQRRSTASEPRVYASVDNTFFTIAPVPAIEETAAVIFSAKPKIDSTGLPDLIGLEYRDALVYGALVRLLDQADAPWRDSAMAKMYGRKFRQEVSRVARVVRFGFGGASLRVHHREFI